MTGKASGATTKGTETRVIMVRTDTSLGQGSEVTGSTHIHRPHLGSFTLTDWTYLELVYLVSMQDGHICQTDPRQSLVTPQGCP